MTRAEGRSDQLAAWACPDCGAGAANYFPPKYESELDAWQRPGPLDRRVVEPAKVRCANGHVGCLPPETAT